MISKRSILIAIAAIVVFFGALFSVILDNKKPGVKKPNKIEPDQVNQDQDPGADQVEDLPEPENTEKEQVINNINLTAEQIAEVEKQAAEKPNKSEPAGKKSKAGKDES